MNTCGRQQWWHPEPGKSAPWAAAMPFVLALIVGCDSPSAPAGETFVSDAALLIHLEYLAADDLRGRRAGSEHERRAADYIRGRYVAYGLEPGGDGYLQPFPVPVPVDGQLGLTSQNVLGVLPGEGALAGQWVILGAHYDHLGWDEGAPEATAVFNGADDNASGTALLLELARLLSQQVRDGLGGGADRRSIMFQAYGAEEVGLIGSTHFCNQPTVPMDSIVAMLNFDMVGRLRGNQLILIGASSSSEWATLVEMANGAALNLAYSEAGIDRSDQRCFLERARPVLFFHTGLHGEYHTPLDDVQLINIPGLTDVGELARTVILRLMVRAEPLAFTGGPDAPS